MEHDPDPNRVSRRTVLRTGAALAATAAATQVGTTAYASPNGQDQAPADADPNKFMPIGREKRGHRLRRSRGVHRSFMWVMTPLSIRETLRLNVDLLRSIALPARPGCAPWQIL